MKQRPRIYYTESQKALMWERWRPSLPYQATKRRQTMARVRVEGFTISLDGYGASPNQDINNPLGVGETELHSG